MIKKLLTVATVALTVVVSAQTNGKKVSNVISIETPSEISKSITYKETSAPGCATISVINPTANVYIYTAGSDTSTPGCSPKAGYVYGSNCYADKEKASFFSASSFAAVTSPTITGVIVGFYKNPTSLRGCSGTTATAGMAIYAGTNPTIAPTGIALATKTASMGAIVAAQTGTTSLFYYLFTFNTPIVAPSTGFYASLIVPTTAGDTAAVFNSTATTANNDIWEKDASNTWVNVTSSWGLSGDLLFQPILCGSNITTGISKNLGLSKNVTIMPNPSTGLVNIVLTLAQTENINITVTNALGQQVVSNKYNGIANEMLSLDLTNQSNGVYFVTVSNGKDKMVQRLILSK